MFTEIINTNTETETVNIVFEGKPLLVRKNLSLAAALLAAGVTEFRQTPVSESPRGPYCMMGVCFDCLVIIDKLPNQQACLMTVREGMHVQRQSGAADLLTSVEEGCVESS